MLYLDNMHSTWGQTSTSLDQEILEPDAYREVLAATDPQTLMNVMQDYSIYEVQPQPTADSTFIGGAITTSTGPLPSRDDYSGPFEFSVLLGGEKTSKSKWTYSNMLNKLYIVWNKIIPIEFRWEPLEPNLVVRALPVYTDAQDMKLPVLRCFLHSSVGDVTNDRFEYLNHVIRSDNPGAYYEENMESKRASVVVPLGELQPGTGSVTVTYKFMCKTTCTTGMMRRPVTVLFTLERPNGEVVGRQKLNVKICSCPRRDMEKDESSKDSTRKRTLPLPSKLGVKKIKTDEEDGDLLNLSFNFEDEDSFKKVLEFNHGAVTSLLRQRNKASPSYPELLSYLGYIELKMRELDSFND